MPNLEISELPSASDLTSAEIPIAQGGVTRKIDGSFFATYDDLQDHITDPLGAHAGSAISFTPIGDLSATNVSDALEELDVEKEPMHLKAFLVADFSTTSGSLVDITGLSVSVVDAGRYFVEAYILTNGAAGGLRLSYNAPTADANILLKGNTVDQLTRTGDHLTSPGSENTTAIDQNVASFGFAHYYGMFVANANGTFQLRTRSVTGGNTTIILKHSFLRLIKV